MVTLLFNGRHMSLTLVALARSCAGKWRDATMAEH